MRFLFGAWLCVLVLSSSVNGQAPLTPRPATRAEPVRLPRLATPDVLGKTPTPTAAELKKYAKYVDRIIDPRNTLDLVVGRTRLLLLKETPSRIQVADPTTAEAKALSPRQITLMGRRVGTTVLTLFFKDKNGVVKPVAYYIRSIQ